MTENRQGGGHRVLLSQHNVLRRTHASYDSCVHGVLDEPCGCQGAIVPQC